MRIRIAILLALGGVGLAFAGSPRDGRLAIDRACVPVGCFPGDTAGYPVQIVYPGSYLVTSDLDVSAEANPVEAVAIDIQSAAVDLDLGGFTLFGPVSCSGDPPVCSAQGNGAGVWARSGATGVRIHDGAIRGFGAYGVQVEARFASVSSLRLAEHGWTPVYLLGMAGRVSDVVATDSGGSGIYLLPSPASAIVDSSIYSFNYSGIETDVAASILGNEVEQQSPGAVGIVAGDESVISGNVIRNGKGGIQAGKGVLLDHNAIKACALGSCGTGDWGMLLGLGSGYTGNAIYQPDNRWAAGGNSLNQNYCDNAGGC